MIDRSTSSVLHAHHRQFAAYCPSRDRWAVLPFAKLIAACTTLRDLDAAARVRDESAVSARLKALQMAPEDAQAAVAGLRVRPS